LLRLLRQVSLPYLRDSWGRTALVIGGIATGVTLIVALNLINVSVLENFQRTIARIAGPADLQITLGIGETGFAAETIHIVRRDRDVAAAVPMVRGTISLAKDPSDTLQLFGADLVAEEDLQRYRVRLVSDRKTAAEAVVYPDSIFITRELADTYVTAIGDQIEVSTPIGRKRLTVRGFLEPEGWALALGGRLAVADIPAAQTWLAKNDRVDQIDVVLKEGANITGVQERLTATLPSTLSVLRPNEHGAQYEAVLASFRAMLTGLSSLCLIAGLFIVYNTTSTAALRRSSVMGRLRVLGADRRKLLGLLMIETFAQGVIGSLLGVALGIPLAWLLSGTITSSMGVIFQLRFPIEQFSIDVHEIGLVAALGVVVALAASWLPVRRMSMVDPLETLRPESAATGAPTKPLRAVSWWLALLAASGASFYAEHQVKSIAWGNFGSTLWFASSIVIAVPIVAWTTRPLSRVFQRWFGPVGKIAVESLARAPTRTGVTVAAIALILTIAITLSSLVHSCRESLRSYFAGFLASDLTVTAVSTEGGWLETPLPENLADDLRAIEGVESVETGRIIVGQLYQGQRIGLLALSPGFFNPDRTPPGWYREGDPRSAERALKDGTGALVSTSFSDRFDTHVGDAVTLDAVSGRVTLQVVGVVPDYVSDRGSVVLSRDLIVKHWEDSNVNRFLVFVAPGTLVQSVRERVRRELGPRYILKVLTLGDLLDYHTDMINRAFAVMNSVQLLIVIVTIAGTFDLLVSRILERRRELALWRVIGADGTAVRRSVLVESATVGGLGALLGIAVGIVTSWTWIGIHFRHLLGYYVDFHFALAPAVWYVTLTIVMTVLAGYGVAYQATRQSVLDGIQME
jgi:putative ABC transport system permease protein